jgi:hypothetical protein
MYSQYKDISNSYLTSEYQSDFPFNNFFKSNPLSRDVEIYARRAGYYPYNEYLKIFSIEPIRNDCSVYQLPCDVILPANKCYGKTKQINHQP